MKHDREHHAHIMYGPIKHWAKNLLQNGQFEDVRARASGSYIVFSLVVRFNSHNYLIVLSTWERSNKALHILLWTQHVLMLAKLRLYTGT